MGDTQNLSYCLLTSLMDSRSPRYFLFAAWLAEDWWRTLTSSLAVFCCSSLKQVLVIPLEAAITSQCYAQYVCDHRVSSPCLLSFAEQVFYQRRDWLSFEVKCAARSDSCTLLQLKTLVGLHKCIIKILLIVYFLDHLEL